jgi:hypothetical protein
VVLALPCLTGAVAYWLADSLKRSGREALLELGRRDLVRHRPREETREPAKEAVHD